MNDVLFLTKDMSVLQHRGEILELVQCFLLSQLSTSAS